MITDKKCPTCGKPLAENALMGLCPECLLQAGFGTLDSGQEAAGKSSAFVPPRPEELARYFPDLEIIELLGRGGMGAVYKARQKRLERLVALKILPPGVGQDPSFAERFEREAKALAQLQHPNIVTLYDSGQVDGLFYFFMEFVDGVNLRQLLDSGHLSSKEALAIVPQICDALQFAHDRGIIHRDIKPENILLNKAGEVKIADFGVAKIVARELTETTGGCAAPELGQTEAGKVIGTPQYMAPEQLSHPLEVDNRADIYALGVVFYQMLTGELPAGKFEPPSRKVQIDVRLDEVVLRALEKKPELRYQQASVMKTQVETIAQTPQDKSSPPTERQLVYWEGILKFQSPLALKFAQIGLLGFFGFLGSLDFIPGWEGCFSLYGLFGFFSLNGIAYVIEGLARHNPRSNPPHEPEQHKSLAPHLPLFVASMSGVLGAAAFCLFPNPPVILVVSILVAALLGIFLGIPLRGTWWGKSAIAVGGINAAIWLIVAIAVQFIPTNSGVSALGNHGPPLAQAKRQRFEPREGMADQTSWEVYDRPSVFNPNGWAVITHMSLGGVAQIKLPGENDDVCRIKLAAGNDDEVTLNVEDLKANNTLTISLKRDQWAELLVNGIGYHVGYPAVEVATDQPDTSPFAFIVVTHSEPTPITPAQSREAGTESREAGTGTIRDSK